MVPVGRCTSGWLHEGAGAKAAVLGLKKDPKTRTLKGQCCRRSKERLYSQEISSWAQAIWCKHSLVPADNHDPLIVIVKFDWPTNPY